MTNAPRHSTGTARAGLIRALSILAWVGVASLTLSWPIASLGSDSAELEIAQEVVAYVDSTMSILTPSSAGIVVSRGEEVIFETYLPGSFQGLPETRVDETSLWPLASGTKSYGAGLLLNLVHEGLVSLDDPVSRYLPLFLEPGAGPYPRTAVSLRHLASHTSGLGHLDPEADVPPDSAVVLTEPGASFRYSWLGVHFLERALEAATGQDYEDLLQERILEPLGLTGTRFVYEVDPELPLMPCMAGDHSDPARHYSRVRPGSRISHGLYATTLDLNRYCQLWANGGALADHTLFTRDLADQAFARHGTRAFDNGDYGLLWWVFAEEGGYVLSGASHTVAAVVPDVRMVVTVTRNYIGQVPEAFSFYQDKLILVHFGQRLGGLATD